ncbi:MAG: addiction module protein [Kiritimatiellae bacterium]|nr:addiction module protein [Kiritimatiellia bacterium]
MNATFNIKGMSVSDKISAMEMLWDDICSDAPDISSPQWHGELLKQREQNVREGTDEFVDWEEAKKDIWNSVS